MIVSELINSHNIASDQLIIIFGYFGVSGSSCHSQIQTCFIDVGYQGASQSFSLIFKVQGRDRQV